MKHYNKHGNIVILILVFLMLGIFSALALAEEKTAQKDSALKDDPIAVEMKTKVLGHEVYPGDEIVLTVTFNSRKEFGAEVLGSLSLGDFELKDRDKTRGEVDGGFQMVHTFVLVNFKAGSYEIPQITFVVKQGGKQKEVKSDLVKITVKSLLQEEARKMAMQQIRDQQANANAKKGQAKIVNPNKPDPNLPTLNVPATPGTPQGGQGQTVNPNQPQAGQPQANQPQQVQLAPRDIKKPVQLIKDDYTLAYVAGAVLGLLLLGGFIFWYRRRPQKDEKEVEEQVVDTRPAHVIAFERLDELEKKQLVAKRMFKPYHLEISEIIKEYFKKRYNLEDAPSLTSSEITRKLGELYLKDLSEKVIDQLLSACDMVLFAKVEPDDKACFERLKLARMIVERTKEADNGVQ